MYMISTLSAKRTMMMLTTSMAVRNDGDILSGRKMSPENSVKNSDMMTIACILSKPLDLYG